jgi:hypothetical protein
MIVLLTVLTSEVVAGTVLVFVDWRAAELGITLVFPVDCRAVVEGTTLPTVAWSETVAGTVLLTGWLRAVVAGTVLLFVFAIAPVAGMIRAMPDCESVTVAGITLARVDCSAVVPGMVRESVDCKAVVAGTVLLNVVAAGVNVLVVTCISEATPAVPELEIKFVGLSDPAFALLSNHHKSI